MYVKWVKLIIFLVRDSQYATGEIKKGCFDNVLQSCFAQLDNRVFQIPIENVECLLQNEFFNLNKVIL